MKVLIIDDQKLFADGIRTLLQKYDPNIVTEYSGNVFSAYEKIKDTNYPDLILLDINDTASANSYDLIFRLNQLHLDIPVMVISATDSVAAAALAIENNASGFVAKNSGRKIVLEAILSVLDGHIYIGKPKQQTNNEIPEVSAEKVTTRQQEVLFLLSQGLLNKQIASELNISANTVKAHLQEIFRSLHVTNRTAAVKNGLKYGLI